MYMLAELQIPTINYLNDFWLELCVFMVVCCMCGA